MTDASSTSRIISLTATNDLAVPDATAAGSERRFGLLCFSSSDAQLRLLDEGASIVVGRKAPSEIVVDDTSVSHQHARFVRKNDEVWVEDLDSRNGTFVAERRISSERLEVGSEVSIGRVRVVLAATKDREPERPVSAQATGQIVLVNPRMKQVYEDATRAARADVAVLILGETGVGKEHVAHAIHEHSARRGGPFVTVNCAAIPPSLLESTLFGHERGAFTGAASKSIGVFERASGGVLFLDEIGELSAGAQAALLRAIETKKITRLGSSIEIDADVRIVAATHCDLDAMVEEGTFRADVFFRLGTVKLEVPPLRERQDEIEPLIGHFVGAASREWNVPERSFRPETILALRAYSWPGNVRQLRHTVERALLLGRADSIGPDDLPASVLDGPRAEAHVPTPEAGALADLSLREGVRRYERALIDEALRRAAGNRGAAAKLLRIPLRTLFRKLRLVGVDEEV